MNTIRNLRPILVWVALGSVGVTSLLALITFLGLISSNSLPSAASMTVGGLMSPLAALIVLAAVLLAVLLPPKLDQARLFAIIGLAIVGAFTAIGVLFSLISLGMLSTLGPLSVLTALVRHLANLAVPAVVALILFKLLSELPAPTPAIGYGQGGYAQPSNTQVTEPSFGHPAAPQQGPGAMWGSANQAASGASAATWQANQTGWGQSAQQPTPQQPAPQQQPMQQPPNQQPAAQPSAPQFQSSAPQQPGHFQPSAPQPGPDPQVPQQGNWYPVDQPPQQPGS